MRYFRRLAENLDALGGAGRRPKYIFLMRRGPAKNEKSRDFNSVVVLSNA
jgi:hypothetical protein